MISIVDSKSVVRAIERKNGRVIKKKKTIEDFPAKSYFEPTKTVISYGK